MNQTPAEIERDIEATRQAVDRTVEALKEKMSPSSLMQSFARGVSDGGADMMGAAIRIVQRNPAPIAVAGVAFAVWFVGARSAAAHGRTIREELSETVRDAKAGAEHAMHAMAHYEKNVERTLARTIVDEPLLVGAVALLVGAAAGAAIPASPVERRYLSQVRDRALDRLRGGGDDERSYQSARTAAE